MKKLSASWLLMLEHMGYSGNMKVLLFASTIAALSASCLGPSRTLSGAIATDNSETALLEEKAMLYKDWSLQTPVSRETINLRSFLQGKKLVLIVYFAPWCSNWRHELPLLTRMYHKYKSQGFDIIGISEYAPSSEVNALIQESQIPYTIVSESFRREDRQATTHYAYRSASGDQRKWGSPWHIFIEPEEIGETDDILVRKAWIGNGDLIESDVELFIQERLGS